MPILTTRYAPETVGSGPNPAKLLETTGPTIQVQIGQPQTRELTAAKQMANGRKVMALIDTGATVSCIDEKFAVSLGLRIVDRKEIGGVAGRKEHNVHLGTISVEDLNHYEMIGLVGVTLIPQVPIILGRDFLFDKLMVYDGKNGRLVITC